MNYIKASINKWKINNKKFHYKSGSRKNTPHDCWWVFYHEIKGDNIYSITNISEIIEFAKTLKQEKDLHNIFINAKLIQ